MAAYKNKEKQIKVEMRHIGNRAMNIFLAIGVCFFLTSCGPSLSTITVNTLKPAAVNLNGVKKIAVMGFDGQGGDAVTNKITARLVESGRFDVFERAQVAKILNEHEMYMTGLVDEKSAANIGKMLGAEALILGSVDTYQVTDERATVLLPKIREKGFHYETKEDKKGNKKTEKVIDYEWYKVNGSQLTRRGNVSITFKVVNVESGQIIAAKNISKTWEGVNIVDPYPTHQDVYPTPKEKSITLPDSATILNRLTDEIVPQLVNMIIPHYVAEIKTYLTVDEQTDTARKFIAAGQYRDAIEILEAHLARLETKPDKNRDELHVVYYDLGFLNEAIGGLTIGGFDKAEEYYKKAIALKGDEIYIRAIAGVRRAREERKKLEEQER